MALSPQELAARVGKRIREQSQREGRPMSQERAQRDAAAFLNTADNKRNR